MFTREAKPNDAPDIAKVHVDSWRTTYVGIVPQGYLDALSYEQRANVWQARLSDPSSSWFCYVAQDGSSSVVGFACGGPGRDGNTLYTGELGAIYLLESCQRQGIGKRLMATVALRLRQSGHKSMLLWVLAANPNRSFYETLGGQPVGEKEASIGDAKLLEIAYGWRDLERLADIHDSDSMQ